jgi:hypothetical protein
MPRIPGRIQYQPYGQVNTTSGNQPVPKPSILVPGPTQAREVFNAPDVDPAVARALNDLQSKIASATQVAKSDPTGNKNLLQGVPLVNGYTGGATGFNFIAHELNVPYTGYRINAVSGGFIEGHCVIAPTGPTPPYPLNRYLTLWTKVSVFVEGTPVLMDIEIYG